MLTDSPHIVIAKAPRRRKQQRLARLPPDAPRRPKRDETPPDCSAGDAADALFRELVRHAKAGQAR